MFPKPMNAQVAMALVWHVGQPQTLNHKSTVQYQANQPPKLVQRLGGSGRACREALEPHCRPRTRYGRESRHSRDPSRLRTVATVIRGKDPDSSWTNPTMCVSAPTEEIDWCCGADWKLPGNPMGRTQYVSFSAESSNPIGQFPDISHKTSQGRAD